MDTKTRMILERPFESTLLKQRQGPGGQVFTYVEIGAYLRRLNEAFNADWSFEVTKREQHDDQLLVEVRLTAGGVVKTGLGGASVTRRRDNGKLVSLADDYKKCEADALKRACRLLGIGAHLYDDDVAELDNHESEVIATHDAASARRVQEQGRASSTQALEQTRATRARLSSKQLAAIWSLAQQRNLERSAFRARVRDRYGVQPEFLSRTQASELITLLSSNGNGSAETHAMHAPGEEA